MITLLLLAVGAGVLVVVSIAPRIGIRPTLTFVLVMTLCVVPYPLTTAKSEPVHFGITDGQFVPMTYSLVIASLLVTALGKKGTDRVLAWATSFVAYLVVLALLEWGSTSAQWSGILHFATAAAAVVVGWTLASSLRNDEKATQWWAIACLFALVVQAVFCVAQLLDVPLSVFSVVEYFNAEHRPIGTFNHPSVLGKVVLVLLMILLPLTRANSRVTVQLSWAAILVGLPLVALTQSRANTVGVVGAVFLWVVLDRRRPVRRRLAYSAIAATVSVPLLLVLLPRFLMDPDGGDRPALMATGLAQIAQSPLLGIGPNSYSEVVGAWDKLAATGFPVHNAFLLAVAELGGVGAALLFLPFVMQIVLAIKTVRHPGVPGVAAMAVLVTLPGMLVVTMTGWGMLTEGSLVLWYLVIGVSLGLMAERQPNVGQPLVGGTSKSIRSAKAHGISLVRAGWHVANGRKTSARESP